MPRYITVDGGTTNTRIRLVCENKILSTKKLAIGVGSGDIDTLKKAIGNAIQALLEEHHIRENDIDRVLASGMLSSEKGLCDLPHIPVPAGLDELHASLYETVIEEVSSIPFVLIRGVRRNGEALEDVDMMRGEETEMMGLIGEKRENGLYILPGSHSKHISVSAEGRIVNFKTLLTGELFAAVMQHTILRYATDFEHGKLIEDDLVNGFLYARKNGLNEALFKTRILKNCFGATGEQCYSFLLGCVLCDEVESILRSEEETVILGGQGMFRRAIAVLLERFSSKKVVVLSDSEVEASTVLGAIKIYEHHSGSHES